MSCRRFLLLGISFTLSGCYYAPDLQSQTMGSFAGGMGTGVVLAKSSATFLSISSGVIGGSIIGSAVGDYIDSLYSPLRVQNPLTAPVRRDYYQTFRPPLGIPQRFATGKIYYGYSRNLPSISPTTPIENSLDDGVKSCLPKI